MKSNRFCVAILLSAALVASMALPGLAADDAQRVDLEPLTRSFDARVQMNAGVHLPPLREQVDAVDRMRAHMPDLMVRFEPTTGVTRVLAHPTQPLTHEVRAGAPAQLALEFVDDHLDALGLEDGDVGEKELTDEVYSEVTGTTHVYWRQLADGIPVYNGQLHVNVNRHGQVQSVNNAFVRGLDRVLNTHRAEQSASRALRTAARSVGLQVQGQPDVLSQDNDPRLTTVLSAPGISAEPITARLTIVPINGTSARLAWNFLIETLDQNHAFDFNVDAVDGKVLTRLDMVSDAQYRVWPQPDESPLHGSTTHTLVTDPQNAAPIASPNGWHDTGSSSFTILRGNNVHAYHDRDGNNSPPSSQPSGGSSLIFDFSANLSLDPVNYVPAAVTNLFYWNNLIHDVQYQHGFDEQAGNFQVNNFGRGGAGGDDVRAEAQDNADGSSRCNANFFTPTDGSRPRMQMFVCNQVSPQRDGDFDNGVIVHEYGHGISIRQVGGPSNSSCLGNAQQPGEGWSDWFGLAYTHEVGDSGTDARGIGTYLFGQGPNGPGIRDLPYSTDNSINNWTYESIEGASIPHGVGSRWAQAIWEVYWTLVAKHGFDPDLYTSGSSAGAAGNLRAMTYVNEGLKNTACSPTFLDARDGIIQAASNLHGGEDVCDVWEAFAAFGLGTDASTGGSNSTSATNGFSVPSTCDGGGGDPDPTPGNCPAGSIDFNSFGLTSYSNQNVSNNVAVADGGDTLVLRDNTWVRSTSTFTVTSGTSIELLFAGGPQGEIHAIGFDENDTLNDDPRHFVLWGTQNWTGTGNAGPTSPQYSGSGNFESFTVPVGQSYTGTMNLVFTNDNDSGSGNEGRFACVRVVDDGGGGGETTLFFDDMEALQSGWTKTGGATDLWRIATDCVSAFSGSTTLGFSRSSPNCDYDVGTAVGTLTTPFVDGSGVTSCTLSFQHFWQTESFNGDFDRMFIEASSNGGSTWSLLEEINSSDANPGGYVAESYPVACSSSMRFRFRFDSEDGVSNDFLGWYIDDVEVTGQ